MKILIVSATKNEIFQFLQHFNYKLSNDLWQSDIKKDFDVFICGIGNIFAAVNLNILLEKNKYSHIIIAGVAGAYQNDIVLGSCFVVKSECMPELYTDNGKSFVSHYDSRLIPETYKKIEFDTLNIIDDLKLKEVNSATVNTLNHNAQFIDFVVNTYNAHIENMEAYGLALTAKEKNIPISQVRCISNYVNEKNREKWEINKAIDVLNNVLIKIV